MVSEITKFDVSLSVIQTIYRLLSRLTNAQHIYLYILKNILYVLSTPACFDEPASSLECLILLLC